MRGGRSFTPVTAFEIGLIVAVKGAVVVTLTKLGWWPDWEARARKREEHKRVLVAYEEWCERTGTRPAADPRVPRDYIADPTGGGRPSR
jgi:hypothetical protein